MLQQLPTNIQPSAAKAVATKNFFPVTHHKRSKRSEAARRAFFTFFSTIADH
jgi:hypothetical protein